MLGVVNRYMLPSQQHMYMEPHVSVAEPDEDGTISVWSSTQSPDACQKVVADVLGLPYHNVRVSAWTNPSKIVFFIFIAYHQHCRSQRTSAASSKSSHIEVLKAETSLISKLR